VCTCLTACDLETSTKRRPRPQWGCCATKIKTPSEVHPDCFPTDTQRFSPTARSPQREADPSPQSNVRCYNVQTPSQVCKDGAHASGTICRRLPGCYPVLTETVTDVQNDRNAFIFKAKNAPVFLHCLALKTKETRYCQTPVTIDQSTRGNTPEDWNPQQYSCNNPKLANPFTFHVLPHQTHCHILSARNTSRNSSGTTLTCFSSILPHFLTTTNLVTVLLTNVQHFSSIDRTLCFADPAS